MRAYTSTPDALYAFIHRVAHVDMHRDPGSQLAPLVQDTFPVAAAAIFDADSKRVYAAGEWPFDPDPFVRNLYIFERSLDDSAQALVGRVLRVGNFPVGAFLAHGNMSREIADALASIVALTFDRYHSYANVGRTEHARQAEELRTTILNSLAHAYKTPLTAILAASSGLGMVAGLSPAQRDLVSLIDEQANLLNELTNRLLRTAKLEASEVVLRPESTIFADLVDDALASCRKDLGSISVDVCITPEDLTLTCDRELVAALITQYVQNAGKYAIHGSTAHVSASVSDGEVIFSVSNLGPEIPPADRERVFDLYFRCSSTASAAPGTGIGLAVARRAALAHGGDVWLTCAAGQTTFFASLPLNHAEAQIP